MDGIEPLPSDAFRHSLSMSGNGKGTGMLQQARSRFPRQRGSLSALLSALFLMLGATLGGGCDDVPWKHNPPDNPEPEPRTCPAKPSHRPAVLESLSAEGPYGFATRDFVFVDTSRPTPPNRTFPGAPSRTLPTRVYYPVCPPTSQASPPPPQRIPVASGGPFPLLAYAHGLTSQGDTGRHINEHLATHGYIVVAPLFPLSSGRAPGGPTLMDAANQPADMAFVMRQVAMLSGADADLAAAVDSRRRGILGFSAGGLTVFIAAYHPVLALDGIQAAVAQAPVSCFLGAPVFQRPVPMLILPGTADELVPIAGPRRAFELAPPPVTLVELVGGTHSGFMNREIPFLNNTDTPECQRLLDSGATQGDITTGQFAEDISRGVGPGALDPSTCTPLCSESFQQTMGASRQLTLARAATLAHFEANLRGRWDAAYFLTTHLDREPDVEVHVKP
ncbi:hypothetical protein F0U61_24255 [Archangium violaceum]|nr:hypothetical protein F0U61_24255 [Archangium violaceum]